MKKLLRRWDTEALSWWLFLGSAAFFVVGAVRDGDAVGIVASGLFAAACVVFLVGRNRA